MGMRNVLTITEAGETLKCKRTKVFALIASGELVKAPRFGKETVVYADSVFRLLEKAYDPPPSKRRRSRAEPEDISLDRLLDFVKRQGQ